MEASKMKNIIVLKNLPSNIVDEAFIILKQNKKIKAKDYVEKKASDEKVNTKYGAKEYMVKEAEMVISNYISKIESDKKINNKTIKELENRYKKLKILTCMVGIIVLVNLINTIL